LHSTSGREKVGPTHVDLNRRSISTQLPAEAGGMTTSTDRRTVLGGGLAFAGVAAGSPSAAVAAGPPLGAPTPFSFDRLTALAQNLAAAPHREAVDPDPLLDRVDFDAFGQITYDPAKTIWGGGDAAVRLFPQGRMFKSPVQINLVDGGVARPVLYSPDLFITPPGHPLRRLKPGAGFAGFRVMNPPGRGEGDWLAFLGAAYFRAAAPFNQYGASARALALNSGGPAREEFPRFSRFWLKRAPDAGLIVYALMESPSVVGAYRIASHQDPRGAIQTLAAKLFFRAAVQTLGVAPITSMFWYGENSPAARRDWRPEIHDSDGLLMVTGRGERIWRPLSNPPQVITNAFQDDNPRGFGLLQRDRNFDHYQDDGAFYDRRPSVWVEPSDPFGKGSVRLLEIPSDSETDDNIGAFWTPERKIEGGSALALNYTVLWLGGEPDAGSLARVQATRIGVGGRPGVEALAGYRRIAIDFSGDALKGLDRASRVRAIVSSDAPAKIESATAYPVVGTSLWRIIFDVGGVKGGPLNLRAYLMRDDDALSETWLYQLFPQR
jgi:glucans biosynthesis protein